MRLIDADALSEKLCETTIFIKDGEVFQRMINDAPTIEPDGGLISREAVLSLFPNGFYSGLASQIKSLPSADRLTDEEDQLKFYYIESIDDYWIGMRIDNFYYADWHEGLGFVWSKSRYLPWGEHVVDEKTLWKEHTYPSEPVEIPFTEWIVGFVKKYFADRPTGWIPVSEKLPEKDGRYLVICPLPGEELEVSTVWYGTPLMPISPVKGKCFFDSDDEWGDVPYYDVVTWMPLPEPYKGGEE